jgi:predicted PurR-regulated permease PerM
MSTASSPAPAEPEVSGPGGEASGSVASVSASVHGRAFGARGGALVRALTRPLWGLLLLATAYTLHWASPLLLPIVLAAVLAMLLSPAVALLARGGLPAPAGAAVVVAVMLAALGTLALQLSDPVQRWINAGPAEFKALDAKLSALKRPMKALKDATDRVSKMTSIGDEPPARPVKVDKPTVFEYVKDMQSAAFTALSTVMLLYFLLASGDLFVRKTVRALPRLRDKIRAVEISRAVQQEIAGYFRTLTVINIGLGTVTGAAMWLLGMPTPLLWGVVVAMLNFIPYIGAIVGFALIALVALITFDHVAEILAPPLAFLVLHVVDGQLLQPFVFGKRLAMNPVIVFLWMLAWSWMWGLGGILLAVPLLVALRIFAEHVDCLAPLATWLARD